ncbi:MAG: choice-of-anchor tandem repeat GloVer-containing protein, partial [Limisphaerales bacterium]
MSGGGQIKGQTFEVVHNFSGNSEGQYPVLNGGLVLQGTTLFGATFDGVGSGHGTVFSINTDGTGLSTLHSFAAPDGEYPYAGVILSSNTLYGTTLAGGPAYSGTLFSVNTEGTHFTTLYSFTSTAPPVYTNSDGSSPYAGLTVSGNTLYGTAVVGGSSANGTVFKVNTDGSGFGVLHQFSPGAGAFPQPVLLLSGNTLYGTTTVTGIGNYLFGSGTVFALSTDGTGFRTLYTFTATNEDISTGILTNSDGANPVGALALSGGVLYGTTTQGGRWGSGTVFKINADGTGFAVLHTFSELPPNPNPYVVTNSDGGHPNGGLVLWGTKLYGTTPYGGRWGPGT